MSTDTEPDSQPSVLRQEGPHRVKVAPGSQSALAPSVGLGTGRLRPAVGADTDAAPIPGAAPKIDSPTLGRRSPVRGSVTEVRHLPGPAAVRGRFAPQANPRSTPPSQSGPSDLERRLSALAALNARTSADITAFERSISVPASDGTTDESNATAPAVEPTKGLRSLFKRRSS